MKDGLLLEALGGGEDEYPPLFHKGSGNGLLLAEKVWEQKDSILNNRSRASSILGKALWEGCLDVNDFDRISLRNRTPEKGKYQAIIALGDDAFSELTGQTKDIEKKRGYIYWSEEYQCKVLGTYHPSYVGKGKTGLIQSLIYDVKLGWKKSLGTFPLQSLILYPSVQEFATWAEAVLKGPTEFLVFDIETPYSEGKPEDEDLEQDPSSEIIRISFGLPDGSAITIPWVGGYVKIASALLNSEIDKVLFNADYDVPRVEVNECPVRGRIIDVMWLFHFLFPDLPRSLAAVASYYTTLPEWKSLGSRSPELYSALDSHATALAYLGVRQHLKDKGMWQVAWRHVVELMVVLRKMRKRGLLIERLGLRKFQRYLKSEMASLSRRIDKDVPDAIKPRKTITAKHLRGRCSCVHFALGKKGLPTKKMVSDTSCGNCAGSGWNAPIVKVLQFNPESSDQLKAYAKAMGHKLKIKLNKDTGEQKETTEKKFLIVLSRQYPNAVYGDVLRHRQLSKLLGTYTQWPMKSCPEWGVNKHGKNKYYKVSTRLGQAPATGRLSSENPNMQNIPKEGPLAERFKGIIHCTPGHILVKRDYSGIEAVLTGYFSGDAEYMRLALLGVHTYRCAQYKGDAPELSLSDAELSGRLKQLKKQYDVTAPGEDVSLYQRFKKINHMTNYGAKPMKIWNESPGVFKDLKEVRVLYAFLKKQAKKVFEWHQKILRALPKEGYRLVSPFMYNRYFWDLPNDLPKAIAQNPQSVAAAIIKESMLIVDATPDGEFLVLSVHDELAFDFPIAPGSCTCHPDNDVTWQVRDERVRQIMERSILELGGLVIHTEGTAGLTYAAH